jgi:hypothetical protein
MKVDFRRAVATTLAAGGLWLNATAVQALDHAVGDPSFEEVALGTLDYYYFQGPPNSPFWKKGAGSTGINAAYNLAYAAAITPDVPDPRTGNQAVDGEGAYNYQILADTFVAGRTYTYNMYTQGHANATSDAQDRLWLYLFAANGDTPVASFDNQSLVRVTFHQDGTLNSGDPVGVGTGAKGVLPFSGFNRSDGSDWTKVGLTYTATAADAGKRIGLAFWANEFGAVDDVALSSVGGVPGDYNGNGTVGPEDYLEWKAAYGDMVAANTGADGNGDGVVDAVDYTVWRNNLEPAAGSGGLAVPEPAGTLGGLFAILVGWLVPRHRSD